MSKHRKPILRKAEHEVDVSKFRPRIYLEILIGRLEMQATALQVSASEQASRKTLDGVSTGNLLEVGSLSDRNRILLQSKDQPPAGWRTRFSI